MARRRQPNRRPAVSAAPVTVDVERLSHDGRGVAHLDGKIVFIDGALPGEQVVFSFTQQHGQFDEGAALEILRASADRVAPLCAHAERCGGCSLQHLSPAAQLAHKQAVLLEQLLHQAGATPARVLPPVTGPLWGYRRRARLSARYVHKKQEVLIGFREKASHYVADITHCDTLLPAVGAQLPALRALLSGLSCAQQIPQVEVAAGDDEVALIVRHLVPLTADDLARLRAFAATTGLRVYSQPGSIESLARLDGPEAPLRYRVADVEVMFQPGDFVQVNAAVNATVVPLALELLGAGAGDTVLDLFCGLGNFTLPLARQAGTVVGVEGEAGLVARATANAAQLGLANANFVCANLFTPEGIAAIPAARYTKVLLDPPRSGAAEFMTAFDFRRVDRVCYVSCNPATLARDAQTLIRQHRYVLEAAGVLDMFPHTTHVESIAVFARR